MYLSLVMAAVSGLVLASPVSAAAPCPGPGHGKLLIQGGGGAPETYTRRGLELCGGLTAKVVVVEYAMGALNLGNADERNYATGRWTAAGATNVTVLDLADEPAAIAAVEAADYIFFDGGDQGELLSWMARAPAVMAAIHQRHRDGALIGGMSAGAAAMPRYMIRGGATASLTTMVAGGTELVAGLGFWPEAITDQHFVKRQRFARLFSAILDNPTLLGVALDEETAILVSENAFDVFGNGTVTVLDARHASIQRARHGENHSASGLRLTILRAGDRFDWRRRRPHLHPSRRDTP